MNGTELVTFAYKRAQIIQGNETVSGDDMSYGLSLLNLMLNGWGAQVNTQWAKTTTKFTPGTAQISYTIGTTGQLVTTDRPVDIETVQIVLNTSAYPVTPTLAYMGYPDYTTLELKQNPGVPYLYSTNPGVPNWTIFLYPVPVLAYPIIVTYTLPLGNATLGGNFVVPTGYEWAAVNNLAVQLLTDLRQEIPPILQRDADSGKRLLDADNQARSAQNMDIDHSGPGLHNDGWPVGWLAISPGP